MTIFADTLAATEQTNSERTTYWGIDFIRGSAAIVVMACHARTHLLVEYTSLPLEQKNVFTQIFYAATRLGHEAVLAFFILSGFLVAGRALDLEFKDQLDLRDYSIDRSTRILVPLIGAVLLTALVFSVMEGFAPPPAQLIANVFGLNGVIADTLKYNAPLWSLAYEIWFYVILGSAIASRRGSLVGLAFLLLSLFVFSVLDTQYLLFWALGALAYLGRRYLSTGMHFSAGLALSAVGAVTYQMQSGTHAFTFGVPWSGAQSETLLALGIALLLPSSAAGLPKGSIRYGATHYLAKISYSVYLTHMPLISLLVLYFGVQTRLSPGSLWIVASACFACLAFAAVFSAIFENSGYRLRGRLKARL